MGLKSLLHGTVDPLIVYQSGDGSNSSRSTSTKASGTRLAGKF